MLNDIEKLKDIVESLRTRSTEEEWFEFKENFSEPHLIGEYISAISNAAAMAGEPYGYCIWGIHDKTHEYVGTTFDWHRDVKNEPLEHYLARQIFPDIHFRFEKFQISEKRVVVLIIPAARTSPTEFDGVRYYRIGSSKVKLSKYPDREANLFQVLTHGLPSIVNTASTYQDLSFEKLFFYYQNKGVPINRRNFKKNLNLLTSDGYYNIMAQLLSDNSHISIRFSIFNGTDKASKMYLVREFGNDCLLFSLDKILEYGEILNEPQADEHSRVVARDEIPLFSSSVYREAVINAIVHNHWVELNAPMFTVFKDRIEILSRGKLPPEQTEEGFFRGESVPVNKELSDIFLQLHISERSGRGVPKIIETYGRESIELRENTLLVSIPLNRISAQPEQHKKNFVQNQSENERSLNEVLTEVLKEDDYQKVEPIVHYLEEYGSITPEKAREITGKSASTARRYLLILINAGVLVAEGKTNNSRYRLI